MERLYGVGPSRGVDGSIPGLGEVECAVLLPGPGGGMEGDGSQMWPHVGAVCFLEVLNYPPPEGVEV